MPKDRPIIYFAMGSTGKTEIVREIIEGFKDKPYRVIAPVRDLITRLLYDEEAKKKAMEFQKIVRSWDGPTNAAKFLWENFGN